MTCLCLTPDHNQGHDLGSRGGLMMWKGPDWNCAYDTRYTGTKASKRPQLLKDTIPVMIRPALFAYAPSFLLPLVYSPPTWKWFLLSACQASHPVVLSRNCCLSATGIASLQSTLAFPKPCSCCKPVATV